MPCNGSAVSGRACRRTRCRRRYRPWSPCRGSSRPPAVRRSASWRWPRRRGAAGLRDEFGAARLSPQEHLFLTTGAIYRIHFSLATGLSTADEDTVKPSCSERLTEYLSLCDSPISDKTREMGRFPMPTQSALDSSWRAAILAARARAWRLLQACSSSTPQSAAPSLTLAAPDNPSMRHRRRTTIPSPTVSRPKRTHPAAVQLRRLPQPGRREVLPGQVRVQVQISTFNDTDEAITKLRAATSITTSTIPATTKSARWWRAA